MAYDPIAITRAETAQAAGDKLVAADFDVRASYWDFDADLDEWALCVVLASPLDPLDFIKRMFERERANALPPYLEARDLRQRVRPDPRAQALIAIKNVKRGLVHARRTMLEREYFEEAILGYVAPDYLVSRPAA